MATKRSFADIHPSRRPQVAQPAQKRRKPNTKPKVSGKAHPVNDLKARARSISRLLARKDAELDAQVRIVKERELQSIQHDLDVAQEAARKSKMIGKYHHIRFFERQKATRVHKRAKKALEALDDTASEEERRKLQQEVEEAQVDINYAIYYPLDKPYISMFAKEGEEAEPTIQSGSKGDPKIRELVIQSTQNGKLDALRYGKLTAAATPPEKPSEPHRKQQEKIAKARSHHKDTATKIATQATQDDDEDSDGGFFE